MSIIKRNAQKTLESLAKSYPALAITGPRQSGKTTLAQETFPEKPYVTLEDPDIRTFALEDPRAFLAQYPNGAILDEVQRCPDLFSYLQAILDDKKEMGLFILTGSQQFGLLSNINQSLAGRIAKLSLLPFSLDELQLSNKAPKSIEELLFKGLYPPIYDRTLASKNWYDNYIDTYVERDVRQLINIKDLSAFQRFIRMCAARTGQIVNLSSLANDCGITHNTAKSWISILEASYIVYLLQPYHNNFNKRLVKSPKLYFYDTGLAACLQNIQEAEQLVTHPLRGPLFENWVISELLKYQLNAAQKPSIYFWRDNVGHEVDVLIEKANTLLPIEIKSGQTIASDFFQNLNKFMELTKGSASNPTLVYAGEQNQQRSNNTVLAWRELNSYKQLATN
jgi:predicted AAA+ superfamily ATPase